MRKTNKKNRSNLVQRLRSTPFLAISSFMVVSSVLILTQGFGVFAANCSSSADCQAQINSLNSQNSQDQSTVNDLQTQAQSYQGEIDQLNAQISSLNAQITANQAQQATLQAQITANQAEIASQKSTLANDIKTTYINGQVTPEEMLATSDNLSDYIDKQEAYSKVQDTINDTLTKIGTLEKQLETQKSAVDALVKQLQGQQATLAAAQAQQASLLNYNQAQQDSYNSQIAANKTALTQLYAKQAAIIAASFGSGIHYGGTGGYPYANATCLNSDGDCGPSADGAWGPYAWGYPPSNEYDPAGWSYRNCTSYAFWRLAQTTGITLTAGSFPSVYHHGGEIKYSVLGNDFANLGYRVDHDPDGAAVLAVQTAGTFGHIMYVEGVTDDGDAIVSQYNAAENGLYSTGTLTNSSTIWFIHVR